MLETLNNIKNGYVYIAVMIALVAKCLCVIPMCYDIYRTQISENVSYVTIGMNITAAFFSLTICIIYSLPFQGFLFFVYLISCLLLFILKKEFEKEGNDKNKRRENFSLKQSILDLKWSDLKNFFDPTKNGLSPNV